MAATDGLQRGTRAGVTPLDGERAGCFLCAVAAASPEVANLGGHDHVVAYLDDDVIALVEAQGSGVLVGPTAHVPRLSTVPAHAALLLAALRRAAAAVQASYDTSGAMIEPAGDLVGAAGHVCYRIVPTMRLESLPTKTPHPVDPTALVDALARSVAARDGSRVRPAGADAGGATGR